VTDERLHTAAEAAVILRCSSWWLKEQARKRRIPFAWIGGSYLFSDGHLSEILRIFEVLPQAEISPADAVSVRKGRPTTAPDDTATVVPLTAKPPRRSRHQPDAA
jgi:hypothetical protein